MKRIAESFLIVVALVLSVNALQTSAIAFRTRTEAAPVAHASEPTQSPRAVVAVNLESPDFTLRQLKYRVFYNKAEVKRIPMNDYDFKAAFTDELLNALAEDRRMSWRLPSASEKFDVSLVMRKKAQPPALDADRILLVNIREYGAFLADLAKDKFYIFGQIKLIDRTSGKKLWDYNVNERIDLDGKVSEMQADNQKGLKEGINRVLEKVCLKVAEDLRRATI